MAVQPDGRIVVAGTSCGGAFPVARYNTDGSPDTTYKQVTFKDQDVDVKKLSAAAQMTKDQQAPARAFTGPTSMVAGAVFVLLQSRK